MNSVKIRPYPKGIDIRIGDLKFVSLNDRPKRGQLPGLLHPMGRNSNEMDHRLLID